MPVRVKRYSSTCIVGVYSFGILVSAVFDDGEQQDSCPPYRGLIIFSRLALSFSHLTTDIEDIGYLDIWTLVLEIFGNELLTLQGV